MMLRMLEYNHARLGCNIFLCSMSLKKISLFKQFHEQELQAEENDHNIPIKIMFLPQMYYKIHWGRKKSPLHAMSSQAVYDVCESPNLITSFKQLGLCYLKAIIT